MTEDQFKLLHQELAAMRGDIDGRLGSLRAEIDLLRADMDRRLDRMEAQLKSVAESVIRLDERLEHKPDRAFVYQAVFTVNASFVAVIGLALILFRTFDVL